MGLTAALMAVGTGVSVLGELSQGQSQYNDLMYQSQIADYNSGMSAAVGETKLEQQQFKNTAVINRIKVGQAASGVDMNSGSAPNVVESARAIGQLDALNIRNDAARESYGYQIKSQALKSQAEEARTASYWNAASTLIGGASSMTKYQGTAGMKIGGATSTSEYNPASWVTWGI